jgi:inhibitor of cysteine peptidase
MKQNKTKIKTILILLIITALLVAGCNEISKNPNPTKYQLSDDVIITNFQSEAEFKSFLEDNPQGYYYGGMMLRTNDMAVAEIAMDSAMPTSMPADKAMNTPDFSETNVQVEGIDEMDIIKTDGNYIYTSSNKNVFIIKAYPAEDAEILSTLKLNNEVTGLFIQDDVLAVAGRVDDFDEIKDRGFSTRTSMTFLDLYDITDRENPQLIKEYRFDGSYFNARLYQGIIYLSTNYNPYGRPSPMPIIMIDGVKRTMPATDIYIYNTDYNSPSFVSIHSINMQTQNKIDSKILTLESNNHMYMSYENIYLTYQETINQYEMQQEIIMEKIIPKLPSQDREYIQRINDVDDDIMSKYEKQSKIMEVIGRYITHLDQKEQDALQEEVELEVKEELKKLRYMEYTVIHKISAENGVLNFKAGNKVPGSVYGQFALDEHDGILRVATTLRDGMEVTDEYSGMDWRKRSPSTNNVYTLNEDMEIIGRLEGLAPTESIFSARYVGNRLYLVTFEQIDPFFVIDLSDPQNPKDLGELKITGYSRYLHPYDETTIIGIGREGTESGRILGLKISLFDVTDVSNPKELVTYVSEDTTSSSGAEWEHKAFLFSREKELLVIPIQNYDWRNPENNYAGAIVFKINKEEITPKGIIAHETGRQYSQGVERSLYIENELYTKSANLLRINNLETLASTKNITLSTENQGKIPIY